MTPLWPQVLTGVIVSICSAIVVLIVQRTSKKLENIATKDFVRDSLVTHGLQLEQKIGEMFVRSNFQQVVNADIEGRMRRVEEAFGVSLKDIADAHRRQT